MRVELEVGQLVAADRDEVRLAEQDVGGLVDGIGEHQRARRRPPAAAISSLTVGLRASSATLTRLRNGSSSWLSASTWLWAKIVARVGVDADGEVVGDQALDVVGQAARGRRGR